MSVYSPNMEANLALGRKGAFKNTKRRALSYLLELQDSMLQEATNPKAKPLEKSSCARVWKDLEELRLTLIGFGRPKPVEARNSRSKGKSRPVSSMTDPTEAPATTTSGSVPATDEAAA